MSFSCCVKGVFMLGRGRAAAKSGYSFGLA
jgi:hypothetical protein